MNFEKTIRYFCSIVYGDIEIVDLCSLTAISMGPMHCSYNISHTSHVLCQFRNLYYGLKMIFIFKMKNWSNRRTSICLLLLSKILYTLKQSCCDQRLMKFVAINCVYFYFTATNCVSCWSQQNCFSVKEP